MIWTVCMFLSYAILGVLVAMAVCTLVTRRRFARFSKVLFAGVFVAAAAMLYPCYVSNFSGVYAGVPKAILASIHHTIRLFIIDGELTFVTDSVQKLAPAWLQSPYIVLASILFIGAALLTFGFILTFFKSVFASIRYSLGYRKDRFVFSDVNERTVCLAEDIRSHHPGAMIVFASADEKDDDAALDYPERLRRIGAITFRRDINALNLKRGSRKVSISLFLMSDDEDLNAKQAVVARKQYPRLDRLSIYVFTASPDSELILSGAAVDGPSPKLRRINDIYLLVNHTLYQKGHLLFDTALPATDGEEKEISVLLLGIGRRGAEMLRALPSFCQMDGYRVRICAVDRRPDARSRFAALCPELMDERHNGDFSTPGEAHYSIRILSGVDVTTQEFTAVLGELAPLSYAFISLGDDVTNIIAAKNLRVQCARLGCRPYIQTVVYDSDKVDALRESSAGSLYEIDFIGDARSFWCEEVVVASELENAALQRHLKWGDEKDFWSSDYNYRSSIASVIHHRMKRRCGIPQVDLPAEQRGEAERRNIRVLEHCRWNAYMRSEGYICGDRKDHLLMTHCDLRPFDELDPPTVEKDDD